MDQGIRSEMIMSGFDSKVGWNLDTSITTKSGKERVDIQGGPPPGAGMGEEQMPGCQESQLGSKRYVCCPGHLP